MKKIIALLIALFIPATILLAQVGGEIRGKIVNAETRETLPGVAVYVMLNGKMFATTTDIEGRFILKPLPAGNYDLTVTTVSYQKTTIKEIRVNSDKATYMNEIGLAYNTLLETEIIWTEPIVNIDDPKKMTILGTELKGKADSKTFTGIMRSMSSEIMVRDDGEIYFRGSRSGDAVYIVDGVKVMNGELGIPSCAIGSISVYTGGVPAKYGDFTGGVVVIETTSYFDWLSQKQAQERRKEKNK
ncbi:MAG: TonB-dependent receptor [Bacteroidota bacterium]